MGRCGGIGGGAFENPAPEPAGRTRRKRRPPAVLLVVLVVVALGAIAYFAYQHFAPSSEEAAFAQLQAETGEVAAREQETFVVTASEEITARVNEWSAFLDSLATTGEDKTGELTAFYSGTTEQVREAVDDCKAQWSVEAGNKGMVTVVPGSMTIERITLSQHSLAGVVIGEKVQLPDGSIAQRVENTVWSLSDGVWRRDCSADAYRHSAGGKNPIEEGTQLDGVVWDLVNIQESPGTQAAQSGDCTITVSFVVGNQDIDRRTPAKYTLCLWTPDGTCHEASELTDTLFTTVRHEMESPMLRDEEKRFSLAYEVPVGTDLTTLRYEIARRDASGSSGSSDSHDSDNAPFLRHGTPQTWALAASAILMHRDGVRDDLLSGAFVDAENVEACKSSLVEWWGVHNRKELLDVLAWLELEGHRKPWDELAAYVASLDEEELQDFVDSAYSDPQMAHRVYMVRKYGAKVGSKSILGFDFCRYVALCRWGYLCGYLAEDEAWDRIMPVAAELQATFSSWEELGENYLIGREFWSYEQTKRDGEGMRAVYEGLLTEPGSPWLDNPWDMNLGVAALGTS